MVDVPLEAWRLVVDVNLNGAFYMCRAFGRRLIEQGEGGAIVNISSIGGKLFLPNNAAYAASKAGQDAGRLVTAATAESSRSGEGFAWGPAKCRSGSQKLS